MTDPSPHPSRFSLDGQPLNALSPDQADRQIIGDEGMEKVSALRDGIVTRLETLDITVLTDAEANATVPGLRAAEGTLVADSGRITVRDAFFFLEL